jgi:hypothetical protein
MEKEKGKMEKDLIRATSPSTDGVHETLHHEVRSPGAWLAVGV